MLTRRETISISSAHAKQKHLEFKGPEKEDGSSKLYPLSSFSTSSSTRDSSSRGSINNLNLLSYESSEFDSSKHFTVDTILEDTLTPKGINKFIYPASIREDLWQSLLKHITNKDKFHFQQVLFSLSHIEHYWGQKGCKLLERISQVCSIEHWEKANELTSRQLEVIPLSQHSDSPEFFVLVVHPPLFNEQANNSTNLISELRHILNKEEHSYSGDNTFSSSSNHLSYYIVEATSAKEALLSILINPDILSVIICDNVPAIHTQPPNKSGKVNSHDNIEDQLLSGIKTFIDDPMKLISEGADIITTLVESIHSYRSEINIYTVCSNSDLMASETLRSIVSRCFASLEDHSELHEAILSSIKQRRHAPFFESLRAYAERPIGVFHALAISRGNSVRQSRWIKDLGKFYGSNLFKAESSATCGGLDSLLDPHGALKDAQLMASRTFGSQFLFFTTNGTSTSNKIVCQALTKPGDIVLVDRACHKSHHYSFVLQGARPCYLDPYPLQEYSIYGGIPLEEIKRTLLAYKSIGKLDKIHLLTLTNCTFDGITYNVQRLIEECLAIKPDLAFLFDEAWFAYAYFHPIFKSRTAMNSANIIRERLNAGIYDQHYKDLCDKLGVEDLDDVQDFDCLIKERLYPNPKKAIIRVYATQSTHKSLTSLRQGSMILCNDDLFESHVHTAFKESYYTHMSTSPNYQIIASMDMGRVQMDLEGYKLLQRQIEAALRVRFIVSESPHVSKYFEFLGPKDLIPLEHRKNSMEVFQGLSNNYSLQQLEKSWLSDDFFVLDPTRLTLYIGSSGLDGETFKVDWLMNKYGIQVNKTSRNSVLFQTNIGTDRSSCLFLVQCLERAAAELQAMEKLRSTREEELIKKCINSLTIHCPKLPSFNHFHEAFTISLPTDCSDKNKFYIRDGDIRSAFYLSYDDSSCRYLEIHDVIKQIKEGKKVIASTFLIPYPPGFPIAVPGQLLTLEILEFMLMLDVKEIHGYDSQLGLRCFLNSKLPLPSNNNSDFDI